MGQANEDIFNRPDAAIAARLRKLSTMPVDVSRLKTLVATEIPREDQPRKPLFLRPLRPASAIAASVSVLILVAALVLTGSSGQALASPAAMARVHRDMVSGHIAVHKVDSIRAASKMLNDRWRGSPDLPQAPDTHVMACCMKSVSDKKVACVLLNDEGSPITMSVAKSTDMRSPAGEVVTRNGVKYHVTAHEGLNMISAERNGRWICLIGESSSERLMAIAEKLEF